MKRGQVTLFIVIALVIVGIIGLFFLLRGNLDTETSTDPVENPQGFIDQCVSESVQKAETQILPVGGFLDTNSLIYEEKKVAYLCYTPDLETNCINQKPLLKKELENQITALIQSDVENCFNKLKNEFRGEDYTEQLLSFEVKIEKGNIVIYMDKKIEIQKGDQSLKINSFLSKTPSPFYDLVFITSRILQSESACNCKEQACYPDFIQLTKDYPQYEVNVFVSGENEKVYTIRDIISKKEFNFAIRNCIRLP